MTVPPVPPPTWGRFCVEESAHPSLTTKVDRYRIEAVQNVRGAPLAGLEPGTKFVRLESVTELPAGGGELFGVTQHLAYTRAAERPDLVTTPLPGHDAICVVIPLKKSEAWWQLALDERDAMFRGASRPGHVELGLAYARIILRKLYNRRAFPGAEWDFVTYFEFAPAHRAQFEALLAALRDPAKNPEWNYVEREAEIWLSRIGTLVT
jgi:hypothetical protein